MFSLEPQNGESASKSLRGVLAKRIELLKGDDRSRAMLIRYRLDRLRDPVGAAERLAAGSGPAFDRLTALKADPAEEAKPFKGDSHENFWDFVLVGKIFQLTKDPQLANKSFELLTEVGPKIVETERLEVVYVLHARHLARQGASDQAIIAIEQGLEKLGEDSLDLLASLTRKKIDVSWNSEISEPGEIENLNKTLARFKKAVDAASLDLAKTARLYDFKTQFNRSKAIEVAIWRHRRNAGDAGRWRWKSPKSDRDSGSFSVNSVWRSVLRNAWMSATDSTTFIVLMETLI